MSKIWFQVIHLQGNICHTIATSIKFLIICDNFDLYALPFTNQPLVAYFNVRHLSNRNDFVSGLHNCLEFSQLPLVFISGYLLNL